MHAQIPCGGPQKPVDVLPCKLGTTRVQRERTPLASIRIPDQNKPAGSRTDCVVLQDRMHRGNTVLVKDSSVFWIHDPDRIPGIGYQCPGASYWCISGSVLDPLQSGSGLVEANGILTRSRFVYDLFSQPFYHCTRYIPHRSEFICTKLETKQQHL